MGMPNFVFSIGEFVVYDFGKQVANFFVCRYLSVVICFNFYVHLLIFQILLDSVTFYVSMESVYNYHQRFWLGDSAGNRNTSVQI